MALRTEAEIQRAHDLLVGVILGEAGVGLVDRQHTTLSIAASVLCWALQHDHNIQFGTLLRELEQEIKDKTGYVFGEVRSHPE